MELGDWVEAIRPEDRRHRLWVSGFRSDVLLSHAASLAFFDFSGAERPDLPEGGFAAG